MKKALSIILMLCIVFTMGVPAFAADTTVNDVPVIYQLTDDVKPGNAFTITGWALTKDTVVYIEKAESAGDTPSDAARVIKPVMFDRINTHFVTCVLPEGMEAANYKVWAQTSNGISNYEILNAPRPFWVGESDIAWEGQTIQIVGVGFTGDHHGAENKTQVKLTVDGTDYPCEITNLEPYSLRFTVPAGIKTGKCDISVTNNGVNWVTMEDNQNFTIVPVGNDPYGLDVAWADHYVYDYRINVKDFGAKGDGVADDTAAFEAANNAIRANGGGVVYIPVGTYNISILDMPAHVIYEGEDRQKSIIRTICLDPKQGYWIGSAEDSLATGYQGFYNLTFLKDELSNHIYADAQVWIGHPWDASIQGSTYQRQNRTFCGYFMKNCDWDGVLECDIQGRALWYATGAKYFMIDDLDGEGNHVGFMPCQFSYATIRNMDQKPIGSNNEYNDVYTIFENNVIDMQTQYSNAAPYTGPYAQSLFCRSGIYVAHNTFKNTGRPGPYDENGVNVSGSHVNDGEVVAAENINSGRTYLFGESISAADEDSVTIIPQMNENGSDYRKYLSGSQVSHNEFWSPMFGDIMVMVVYGKGAGQIRRMGEYNTETLKIHVTEPWDVIPDETSHIMLSTATYQTIYYDNYAENCEKGFWFYGGAVDSVMAENTLVDVEGLTSFGFHIDSYSSSRLMPNYYVSIRGNKITGDSRYGDACPIRIATNNESRTNVSTLHYSMIDNFACDIRHNTMSDALSPTSKMKNTESSGYKGIEIGTNTLEHVGAQYKSSPHVDSSKAYIIEGNNLTNTRGGIKILGTVENRTQGILIKGNEMRNTKARIEAQAGVRNVVKVNQK